MAGWLGVRASQCDGHAESGGRVMTLVLDWTNVDLALRGVQVDMFIQVLDEGRVPVVPKYGQDVSLDHNEVFEAIDDLL